jgi:hypothetical protein
MSGCRARVEALAQSQSARRPKRQPQLALVEEGPGRQGARGEREAETERCVCTATTVSTRRRPTADGHCFVERGEKLPKRRDLLAAGCEVSGQREVPESAKRMLTECWKIARFKRQTKCEPPITIEAVLAR